MPGERITVPAGLNVSPTCRTTNTTALLIVIMMECEFNFDSARDAPCAHDEQTAPRYDPGIDDCENTIFLIHTRVMPLQWKSRGTPAKPVGRIDCHSNVPCCTRCGTPTAEGLFAKVFNLAAR
uniref:Uncharacterized protein n=1 Tax=Anopheles culicifacies TaxID=139723 RepID=A0A182MMW5_9DIPT